MPRVVTPRFQVGGTLRPGALYVQRPADEELPRRLAAGVPCVLLGPRQLGKSSLCMRTAAKLRNRDHQVAVVDCTSIGTSGADADSWLFALAEEISDAIDGLDPAEAWRTHDRVPPVRRFLSWLRATLEGDERPLVLILDEVDVLKAIDFPPDEVLGALRGAHEARVHTELWERFTFCLVGVASPATLGSDPGRTPVNVSTSIELADFTGAEARSLLVGLSGLGAAPDELLDCVMAHTEGHPWMTLRLCAGLVESGPTDAPPALRVARLVQTLFYARGVLSDVCLLAAARQLLAAPRLADQLGRYEDARRRRAGPVRDSDLELLLTGIVAERGGTLVVRNPIFSHVFDEAWLEGHRGRRELTEASRRWIVGGRDDADLLRGQSLASARRWARDRADLTQDETALLLRSSEVVEEERLQAARTQAQARQLRLALASLTVLSLALIVAAWAWVGKSQAERQQRALRLANEARFLASVPNQQSAALRVALEALEVEERPETTRALVEALQKTAGRRFVVAEGDPVFEVACSPDSRWVAGRSVGGTARVVDRETGTMEEPWPNWPRVGAEPNWVGTFDTTGGIRIRAPDGAERTLTGHLDQVYATAVSPDGAFLVTGGDDDQVRAWELATARSLGVFLRHQGAIRALTFCPDGRTVVSGSDDGTLGVWRLFGSLADRVVPHARWVDFAEDGTLVTAGPHGAWLDADRADGAQVMTDDLESAIVVGPLMVASSSAGKGRLRILNRRQNTVWTPAGWTQRWHGALTPDARWLVSQRGPVVFVWAAGDHTMRARLNTDPQLNVGSASLSPDGTRVVAAGVGGSQLWRIDDPVRIAELDDEGYIAHAVFSPSGRTVATMSHQGHARLFDAQTGRPGPILHHGGKVVMGVFSSDGSRLATAAYDGHARLWDVATGELIWELPGQSGLVRVVAMSADDRWLAAGGEDTRVHLYDLVAGETAAVLTGHLTPIRALAFSPDGRFLASASEDSREYASDVDPSAPSRGFVAVHEVGLAAWRERASSWLLEPTPSPQSRESP
ncbi:MAG: AAA-like domain-containing protein [Myxococcota bacterium]